MNKAEENEIKVFYCKSNEEDPYDEWDVKVSYKDTFPTLSDIENDYVELPIPNKFWWGWGSRGWETNERTLDEIFGLMNNYSRNPIADGRGGEMQNWIKEHGVRHTSMSVGDAVSIGDKTFVCARFGWNKVA